MGVVNTTNTFVTNDVITSTKLNDIIDNTTFTATAITGTTLALSSGQLKVNSLGITANELADGSVTAIKLASSALLPSGAVMPFAMSTAPTGWLSCDGSVISRTTYALLFAAIGTTFGIGDGSTTFAVPDLRGRFVRSTGSDGTATSLALGVKQSSDNQSHNHGISDPGHSHSVNNPSHNHSASGSSDSQGAHNHNYPVGYEEGNTNDRFTFGNASGPAYLDSSTAGAHSHNISVTVNAASTSVSVNAAGTGVSVQNSGGSESRPHNMALNYCIKY